MTVSFEPRDHYWMIIGSPDSVFSSTAGKFISSQDETYRAWLSLPQNELTKVNSQEDLQEVLRINNVPPYHHVAKSVVLSRLTDVQLEGAIGGMTVRQQERWRAPDSPFVYADDPEVIAIIQAVGADPDVILAPEI